MWALVFILSAWGASPGLTSDHVEFATQELCEKAAQDLRANITSDSYPRRFIGCFETQPPIPGPGEPVMIAPGLAPSSWPQPKDWK